mgnify:CR=1 FL=1
MDKKICLDSDISIEILKNTEKGINFLNLIEKDQVYITTISIFELCLREKNLSHIEELLSRVNILDFSEVSAKKSSEILRNLKSRGEMIDIRDLFIASTAIVNDCVLATLNKKHFKNIKELKIISV